MVEDIQKELRQKKNPGKIAVFQRFFKTGKGEYGEGDLFLGISVPDVRTIAKRYDNLDLNAIAAVMKSPFHEERLAALLVLMQKFQKSDLKERKEIYHFYLASTARINNWDLVDVSADKIVGQYLLDTGKGIAILRKLAKSKNLWERRIAMLSTYQFIKSNRFAEALEIAEILLHDSHDLIQKAVGWMLREIGNRSLEAEEKFLKKRVLAMPRTALRYAIEKFPESQRRKYLGKGV